MKRCSRCRVKKASKEFSRNISEKSGRHHRCKSCTSQWSKTYYKKNAAEIKVAARKYYRENYKKSNARNKKWQLENPEKVRASYLKRLYKLTYEKYLDLLKEQDNACRICRRNFSNRGPFVDHCHKTGEVRGLLCHSCNCLLGYCRDDSKILRLASQYLKKHLTNKKPKNRN